MASEGVSNDAPVKYAGCILAIIGFVAAQFINLTLFTIASFIVTVQKVIAILFFPTSLFLIGRIRVSRYLLLFAAVLLNSYLIAHFIEMKFSAEMALAVITVLIGYLGAIVLYTALTYQHEFMSLFARVWIFFSTITALLTVFQAMGILPLFNVSPEKLSQRIAFSGLYRGVGLRDDPNFQALVLTIGIAFIQVYERKYRLILTLIVLSGVISTFSRMGIVTSILVILVYPFVLSTSIRRGRHIRTFLNSFVVIIALCSLVASLFLWGPYEIQAYLKQRYDETSDVLVRVIQRGNLVDRGQVLSSAVARVILARTSFLLALQNWIFGVGAYNTERIIYESSGIDQVSHNTYIELFLIGGISGIMSIIVYTVILVNSFRCKGRQDKKVHERTALALLCIIFGIIGLFLSLTYNSIIWLPLVIAIAIRKKQCI
jgi:hypothetical protein